MAQSRCTISEPVAVEGIGLHSGADSSICLKPAPVGQGVVFCRVDLPEKPSVRAHLDSVIASDRRTALGLGDTTVETVEHLLAAVYACGVDDLTVDLDGPEPPIGDGSAGDIFEALASVEVRELDSDRRCLNINIHHTLEEAGARYTIRPSDSLRVDVTVEWDHPLIGRQSGCYDVTRETFVESLARARTFGFLEEVKELREKGLVKGASYANAVVLTETGIVGSELRWPDEFVRHKAVDIIGDLALLGVRINAEIAAFRPNHRGNIALARFLEGTADMERPL